MNPCSFLLSVPGLAWSLTARGSRARVLGLVFLTTLLILLVNPHSKAEYLTAAWPLLFAPGAVALEQLARPGRTIAGALVGVLLAVSGALAAPLTLPILPVESFVHYQRALGLAPSSAENKVLADLPQFFADMHGWEALAKDVSAAYLSLPEAERATTVALPSNCGEAAALELYATSYPLPRVICGHNAYWTWGPGPAPITTLIRLGAKREDYLESYEDVEQVGLHRCAHCMPHENELRVWVARRRRVPVERDWAEFKDFE